MIRVALLDDNQEDRKILMEYLRRFRIEENIQIEIASYDSGLEFLESYGGGYDVIFLDIEMPGLDGLEVSKEIRQMDEMAGIIFITNMAQYAICGYEVNAIDFMLKPVKYPNFSEKFKKALD